MSCLRHKTNIFHDASLLLCLTPQGPNTNALLPRDLDLHKHSDRRSKQAAQAFPRRKLTYDYDQIQAAGKLQVFFTNDCKYAINAATSYRLPVDRPDGYCENGEATEGLLCNTGWFLLGPGETTGAWVADTDDTDIYVYAYIMDDPDYTWRSEDAEFAETLSGQPCNDFTVVDCLRWRHLTDLGTGKFTYTFNCDNYQVRKRISMPSLVHCGGV